MFVTRRALQVDGIRPQIDADVEAIFQQAHILVPRPKERFDVGADPDAFLHACVVLSWRVPEGWIASFEPCACGCGTQSHLLDLVEKAGFSVGTQPVGMRMP